MRRTTTSWKTRCCFALFLSSGLIAGGALSGQGQGQGQGQDEDFRFRPEQEREEYQKLRRTKVYTRFQAQDGIPVSTGFAVNLYKLKLAPWKRQGPGITGAYVNLDGQAGLVDLIEWEIAVGAQTKPERHLFEEQMMVLRGEGETHVWQSDPAKKVVIPWRRGTVFSPPLNTWHQHVNKGREPALMAAVTDLPLKMDIFRNPDFIFGVNYNFSDRYAGQANYFDPENSIDFSPKAAHSMSIVNLIRDAWTWRLFHAGQGYGDIDRHFKISQNNMGGHIESWPAGAYERAHKHGPGLTIVHLGGPGYSLLWPPELGMTPWKDGNGDKVTRVDWVEGTVVIPPLQWYHQHFAAGPANAKFIVLGGLTTSLVSRGEQENNSMIQFKDEDPYVRQLFEKELAKGGTKVVMPPMKELIAMEKAAGGGRIQAISGTGVK